MIWSSASVPVRARCVQLFRVPASRLGGFRNSSSSEGPVQVAQLCPILCDPMDCIVHGILQARILEWVAFPFSRASSQSRDQTQVSCIAVRFFTSWATMEALSSNCFLGPWVYTKFCSASQYYTCCSWNQLTTGETSSPLWACFQSGIWAQQFLTALDSSHPSKFKLLFLFEVLIYLPFPLRAVCLQCLARNLVL